MLIGDVTMKRMILRLINIENWEKQEKTFVIAMMIMVLFNFSVVIYMLNR